MNTDGGHRENVPFIQGFGCRSYREEVLVFAKLPSSFKIDTSLGSYNPDWVYVEDAADECRVYFMTETKGGKSGEPALREA